MPLFKYVLHGCLILCLLSGVNKLVFAVEAGKCEGKRYVFDVGSSTLKGRGYVVDACNNVVNEVLPAYRMHSGYQLCLNRSSDGATLAQECIDEGMLSIKEIKAMYKTNCTNKECVGIATGWARKASNASEVVEQYKKAGIALHIISQEQEASLAFHAARDYLVKHHMLSDDRIVVFDMGGASFQIIEQMGKEQVFILGNHGTDSLEKALNDLYQSKPEHFISCKLLDKAYAYVYKEIGEIILRNINSSSRNVSPRLYGVSLFLRNGVRKHLELEKDIISKQDIHSLVSIICGKSYKNMSYIFPKRPAHYIPSSLAGLLMLKAIMEALGADSVHMLDVDIQDYVAISPEFWESSSVMSTISE